MPTHLCVALQIYAPLRRTKINPKATLNNLIISLRPTDHVIKPLTDPRDALPRGRVMHRMLLTYKLSLAEGGSITPKVPPLDSKVYDGTLEGQLFGVFDSNKKRVAFGDVYPDSVTVGKGENLYPFLVLLSIFCPARSGGRACSHTTCRKHCCCFGHPHCCCLGHLFQIPLLFPPPAFYIMHHSATYNKVRSSECFRIASTPKRAILSILRIVPDRETGCRRLHDQACATA